MLDSARLIRTTSDVVVYWIVAEAKENKVEMPNECKDFIVDCLENIPILEKLHTISMYL